MENEYVINNQIPAKNTRQLAEVLTPMLAGEIESYIVMQKLSNGCASWFIQGSRTDCIGLAQEFLMIQQARISKEILDEPLQPT